MRAIYKKGEQFRVVMVDSDWRPGLPVEPFSAAGLYSSADLSQVLAYCDPVVRPRQSPTGNENDYPVPSLYESDAENFPRKYRNFREFSRIIS